MTEPEGWQVYVAAEAAKALRRLAADEQERVRRALVSLRADPFTQDVKPLRGRPLWRLRVGGWRLLLRVDRHERAIVVVDVGSRGDIYK